MRIWRRFFLAGRPGLHTVAVANFNPRYPMLRESPAKLYLGDDEFCDVFDWTYLGVIGYQVNGRATAAARLRKVWSMLCDREPRAEAADGHSLKRGADHIQVTIESARPSKIDGRTYSLVKFTTDDDSKFGGIG